MLRENPSKERLWTFEYGLQGHGAMVNFTLHFTPDITTLNRWEHIFYGGTVISVMGIYIQHFYYIKRIELG